MNNIEKLIENGGWRPIKEISRYHGRGRLMMAIRLFSGEQSYALLEHDALLGHVVHWMSNSVISVSSIDVTHFMPLDTAERMAKVIEVLMMRLAQIASGDYKACGATAEEVAASALLEVERMMGVSNA